MTLYSHCTHTRMYTQCKEGSTLVHHTTHIYTLSLDMQCMHYSMTAHTGSQSHECTRPPPTQHQQQLHTGVLSKWWITVHISHTYACTHRWCSVVWNEGANCKSYSTAPVCVPPLDGCVGEVHSVAPVWLNRRGYYSYNFNSYNLHVGPLKTLHTQFGQWHECNVYMNHAAYL